MVLPLHSPYYSIAAWSGEAWRPVDLSAYRTYGGGCWESDQAPRKEDSWSSFSIGWYPHAFIGQATKCENLGVRRSIGGDRTII